MEENDAIDKFYPGMLFEQCFGRDLMKCHQLRSVVPSSVFAKMKAEVMPTLPEGNFVSSQDVLSAFLAANMNSEVVMYFVNIRERHEAIPNEALANAEMIWFASRSGSTFKATDMRTSIQNKGAMSGLNMALASADPTEKRLVVSNSWVKVQYLPNFGGKAGIHMPVLGWSSLNLIHRTNFTLTYACTETEHIVMQWGLDDNECAMFTEEWSKLGVDSLKIPGGLVQQRCSK